MQHLHMTGLVSYDSCFAILSASLTLTWYRKPSGITAVQCIWPCEDSKVQGRQSTTAGDVRLPECQRVPSDSGDVCSGTHHGDGPLQPPGLASD